MTTWCQNNGLILNHSKTDLLLFSPISTKLDFSLLVRAQNKSLPQSQSVKFLGLQMDKNLSWDTHIECLTRKLASNNFAIVQIREYVNTETLKTFYYGCVYSVLSYCILCWGKSTGIQKVFILQKRIIRSMFKLSLNTSCRTFFKQHGILTVYSIFILQSVCYVRKNINKYIKCGDINKYCTRSANDIYVPPYRLTQVNKGPFTSSVRMYNHLLEEIKSKDNFNCFKNSVKNFLIHQCFYTYEEYFNFNGYI